MMNRKFLSVVLSAMLTVTSCIIPCTSVSAVSDDTTKSMTATTTAESNAGDPVELVFYSYLMDGESQPGHKQYVYQQKGYVHVSLSLFEMSLLFLLR